MSANEKLYRPRHIWNDYRPCLDRVSTDYRPLYRPTVDRVSIQYRPSVDWVSTDCRLTIDRVSTNYRPLYRPISRSTLPTVKKIRMKYPTCEAWFYYYWVVFTLLFMCVNWLEYGYKSTEYWVWIHWVRIDLGTTQPVYVHYPGPTQSSQSVALTTRIATSGVTTSQIMEISPPSYFTPII